MFVQILPVFRGLMAFRRARERIEAVQQLASSLHALSRGTGKYVGRLKARHGRIVLRRAYEQRAVRGAERAARADVWSAEDRIADALNQPNIGSYVALARAHLRQHRTNVRRVGGRAGLAAQK